MKGSEEQQKQGKGFLFDVLTTLSGQLFVMLIALMLNKLMSMRLGPESFTEYTLITKAGGILAYIILVSLGISLPRYIPMFRAQGNEKRESATFFASIIILVSASLLMALIAIVFRRPLCMGFFGRYDSGPLFACFLFALKSAFTAYLYALLRADGEFIRYSACQIVIDASCLASSFAFSSSTYIVVAMSAVGLLFSFALILQEYWRAYKDRFDSSDIKIEIGTLLKYGIPRIPGEIILFSFTSIPLMILNSKIGAFHTAGFTISLGIISAATPLFSYVGLVLLPYASEALAKKEYGELNRRLFGLILLFLFLSICMVVAIRLLDTFVITLLYSTDYLQFVNTVHLLMPAIIPMSLYLLLRNPLDALAEFPINTVNLAIAFFVLIVGVMSSSSANATAFSFVAGYFILGFLSVAAFIFVMHRRKAE